MQTTLLSVAVAIILALVAALVGPLLIDWNGYRPIFESQASRVLGTSVRVAGPIDLRLLPSPRLTLNDIQVGASAPAAQAGSQPQAASVKARSLGVEFALGPLLRGEWHATELTVGGPEVRLVTDANGQVGTPGIAFAFNPGDLAIEKLSIEDGKFSIANPDGAAVTFDRVWFNGDARSLIGPLKGEGAVTIGDELYPFRLSTGRYGDDDTLKLKINVDPVNRPLSIETDGVLTLKDAPQFDGTLKLAKPVGVAQKSGGRLTQPWRITAKLKASAQSALMEQVEYLYGSEEQGVKLTGVADFKFGKEPRFDGVLSGRQIDLDRVLASEGGGRPPPAAAIRELIELGGGAFAPTFPIAIGIGIDQVTLGGSAVQNLRGDIVSDARGWNLDRFEFRAPGYSRVRLSGHLAVDKGGVAFTGPAEIDANDPKMLAAWLEGQADKVKPLAPIDVSPISIRGDVTLGSEKIAIDNLKAEFDRKVVSGRFAYVFASGRGQARLDAALNAPDLDLDATLGFGMALMSGSSLERPRDMTIAIDIGRASVGGFTGRDASARLKVDGNGLQIDKLAVADLGGAAFSASGRIDTSGATPLGSINVDLNAPEMEPVLAVLQRFAPGTVAMLSDNVPMISPANLQARLTIDGTAPKAIARVAVGGRLGRLRVALNAQGNADADVLKRGDLKIDGKLDSEDGRTLMTVLGLSRSLAIEAGPASLTLALNGPANGDLRTDARLVAKGLDARATGTAQPFAVTPSASLKATVARANIAPLRGPARDDNAVLPATFEGRLTVKGGDVSITEIDANVGGSRVRGKLALGLGAPRQIAGEIEADTVDAGGLMAAAIGMPAAAAGPGKLWVWSTEPFGDGVFGNRTGAVTFKARRLDVTPQIAVREFRAMLRFADREFTVDDMSGDIGGGALGGSMTWRDIDLGVSTKAVISVKGAQATTLLPGGARPPVTGKLDVAAEVSGSGMSPIALIGSLQGGGTATLTGAQLAGLDPRAFDTVTRAVDQGVVIDNKRVAGIVEGALDSGQLAVSRAELAYTVNAGQLRLTKSMVESRDADLGVTGQVDFSDGTVDTRLVLSGTDKAAGRRPDVFVAVRGPIAEMSRSIDVSALTGWLTLRSVEHQAQRLKALEAAQPKPQLPEKPPAPGSSSAVPAPPQAAADEQMAPALPMPLDIRSAPRPAGIAGPTAPTVSPQN
ncbi:AsmA family protein [Undibacter mobilis]|uniref:AsmA family protein n=1 Tax=Undibacter mobilis TaxID=2292256 RepID=A0A371BBM4_9BRAD|nr:AsmA family protein [Undibacter mobilis]RDV05015.1 AsmA family protein [Undibacter mobilis]